jgi:hypothetical protein
MCWVFYSSGRFFCFGGWAILFFCLWETFLWRHVGSGLFTYVFLGERRMFERPALESKFDGELQCLDKLLVARLCVL